MSRLFYQKPADKWEEALPIGNGRMGAMVFGTVEDEHLQLNEDSIWYGASVDRINPDALPNLIKLRQLILDEKIPEAEELLKYAFSGTPQSQRTYQSLGDLLIHMKNKEGIIDSYERELLLDTATVRVRYKVNGITYTREYFVSEPEQVLVIRFSADQKRSISFDTLMTRERFFDRSGKSEKDTVIMQGNLGKGGVEFCVACKVKAVGGNVQVIGEHIVVKDADEATLYLSASSTFYGENYQEKVLSILQKAMKLEYQQLKERHINDYQKLYKRVQLTLEYNTELDKLTTDLRMAKLHSGSNDNGLLETYFNFGRYLLISSSRPGTLPANLQGIWNKDMKPSWDSKFTININTQMNYWPAEVCNLSECHQPLFDLITRLAENGKKTAREMYGCRGFVAHHNTDLWADTAPQDIYIPSTYWVMGGAWLCIHLWTHYEYTMDKAWLKKAYPLIKESVQFFLDFLIEHNELLVTCPSISPENTYILASGVKGRACIGASMDIQILRDLFNACVQSAQILHIDYEFASQVEAAIEKLPEIKVGKYGQIMEWHKDYEEAEPGHRHISQLYALHPSFQISIDETPRLAEAARKTLERRLEHGGGHTGWSCAWIINFYARLRNGNKAYENLMKLISNSTFNNLLDNHPVRDGKVFQIDGNLGACAAIAEMLIQSDGKRIILLPALPEEWRDGSIRGLCIRGGAEIEIEWKDGKLVKVNLTAKQDLNTIACYNNQQINISMNKDEQVKLMF